MMGMMALTHLGIKSRLASGSLIYRVGPHELHDCVAFSGPGNMAAVPNMFHMWLQAEGQLIDFTCGDWRTPHIEALPPDSPYIETDGSLPPISWTIDPPEYIWRPVEELTAPWKPVGTPELGAMWYHEGVSPRGSTREELQRYFDEAGRHFKPHVQMLWPAVKEALPPPLPRPPSKAEARRLRQLAKRAEPRP
jgi:hypothetical protein